MTRFGRLVCGSALLGLLTSTATPLSSTEHSRLSPTQQIHFQVAPFKVETLDISCRDEGSPGRSLTVASPDVRNRAYVKVRAIPHPALENETTSECKIVWTLHISSDYGRQFSPVVADERNYDSYWGADFQLLGWSKTGDRVLGVMRSFAGDYTEWVPVVYDVRKKELWKTDLGQAFRRTVKDGCSLLFHIGGFTGDELVAFEVVAFSYDPPPGQDPCFERTIWALAPELGSFARLSKQLEVFRYGQISWADSVTVLRPFPGKGLNAQNPKCALLTKRTVDFKGNANPSRVEWRRCGKVHSAEEPNSFPQHTVLVLPPSGQSEEKDSLTIDNLTPYSRDKFYISRLEVTDLNRDGKEELLVEGRYYSSGNGLSWCLLGEDRGKLQCWRRPDLNNLAKSQLHSDETFCCSDWSMTIQSNSIRLTHEIYSQCVGTLKGFIHVVLVPRNSQLVAVEVTRTAATE